MWWRNWISIKRHGAPVMDQLGVVRSAFWTTHMQTVLIKQAIRFSMRFWRWKISSYMVLMSQTLPKLLHQNKVSTLGQIERSWSGGHPKQMDVNLSLPAMSFQLCPPCKAIQNHHVFGNGLSISIFGTWDWLRQFTNPAYIQASLMVIVFIHAAGGWLCSCSAVWTDCQPCLWYAWPLLDISNEAYGIDQPVQRVGYYPNGRFY